MAKKKKSVWDTKINVKKIANGFCVDQEIIGWFYKSFGNKNLTVRELFKNLKTTTYCGLSIDQEINGFARLMEYFADYYDGGEDTESDERSEAVEKLCDKLWDKINKEIYKAIKEYIDKVDKIVNVKK